MNKWCKVCFLCTLVSGTLPPLLSRRHLFAFLRQFPKAYGAPRTCPRPSPSRASCIFRRHSNVVMVLQLNPVRSACPPRALPAPSPGFSRHRHAHPCRHANVNFVANVYRAPASLQNARSSSHRWTSSAARWRTVVKFCTRPSALVPGERPADAACSMLECSTSTFVVWVLVRAVCAS